VVKKQGQQHHQILVFIFGSIHFHFFNYYRSQSLRKPALPASYGQNTIAWFVSDLTRFACPNFYKVPQIKPPRLKTAFKNF